MTEFVSNHVSTGCRVAINFLKAWRFRPIESSFLFQPAPPSVAKCH